MMNESSKKPSTQDKLNEKYQGGDLWDSMKFGLGMVVILFMPLYIFTQLTLINWMMDLTASVLVFYFIISVLGSWKDIKLSLQSNTR